MKQNKLSNNFSGIFPECGCDEAGRGCLAGPVVAAAVILPPDFDCPQLNDSKQLTEKERDALRPLIEQNALAWAVAEVDNREIDKINILNASILAMQRAIAKLKIRPGFIIVDGNRFKAFEDIPHQTIVKGDAKYLSIAAASVLAKTHRDEMITRDHAEYPQYAWDRNKAYPTVAHRKAIQEYGITPLHRVSFNLTGEKVKPLPKRKRKKNQTQAESLFGSETKKG
ncbi:MAG: ribonuclease HII [Paludibacter sp.]|jgi:ribonuclease HII|nr:ribonuclease HII [Paludibacter sp.]